MFPGSILARRLSSLTRLESVEERKENKQCCDGDGGQEVLPGKCDAPMLLGTAAQSPFCTCVCCGSVPEASRSGAKKTPWREGGGEDHHTAFFFQFKGFRLPREQTMVSWNNAADENVSKENKTLTSWVLKVCS